MSYRRGLRLTMGLAVVIVATAVSGLDSEVAIYTSGTTETVSVPLKAAPASQHIEGFGWPGIDFADRDWISKKPLEEGLTGIPETVTVDHYGIFHLGEARFLRQRMKPDKLAALQWIPADLSRQVDDRASFVSGTQSDGTVVFLFDTDNDEDFSDETIVAGESFGTFFKVLASVADVGPYGYRAGSTVSFEYLDNGEIRTGSVAVEAHRFEGYIKKRALPVYRGTIAETRVGTLSIDGTPVTLGISNGENFATFDLRNRWTSVLWDKDENGSFDHDRNSPESFRVDRPFSIHGVSFVVERISPTGDRLILRTAGQTVASKRVIKPGVRAPAFEVKDIDGRTIRLADYRGRYLVLDFWFTTCAPCVEDTPALKQWYDGVDRNAVEMFGVSVDRRREDVRAYGQKNGTNWPQVLDTVDNASVLSESYNISGYPSYVLIDPEGTIVTIGRLEHVLAEVESRI